jgi:hypothetical protein
MLRMCSRYCLYHYTCTHSPDTHTHTHTHTQSLPVSVWCSGKPHVSVVVDPSIARNLRPHQREGVKFMFDCITGAHQPFYGCILADDMYVLQPYLQASCTGISDTSLLL